MFFIIYVFNLYFKFEINIISKLYLKNYIIKNDLSVTSFDYSNINIE